MKVKINIITNPYIISVNPQLKAL